MITRLNMLILMEHDLEEAVSFYESLGLKLVFRLGSKWAEFALPGGVKLGLCPTTEPQEERRTGIVLEVEDIKRACEFMREKQALLTDPLERVHGIMASIKDPSGNIVDLYQPTPERVQELVKKAAQQGCCGVDAAEATLQGNVSGEAIDGVVTSGCCQKRTGRAEPSVCGKEHEGSA